MAFLKSIYKNKEALLNYFIQNKPKIDESYKKEKIAMLINDLGFWRQFNIVIEILDLINYIQYIMFEFEGYRLYKIATN